MLIGGHNLRAGSNGIITAGLLFCPKIINEWFAFVSQWYPRSQEKIGGGVAPRITQIGSTRYCDLTSFFLQFLKITRETIYLLLSFDEFSNYNLWFTFVSEWWPRSQEKIGGGAAPRITQIGSTHRPRSQHWLLQIGRFQHCPREEETQFRNFRHVVRDNKVGHFFLSSF